MADFFKPKAKKPRTTIVIDQATEDTVVETSHPVNTESQPQKTKHREWREVWLKKFLWLEKSTDKDGEPRAVCTWCTKAGKKNAFCMPGSTNLQSSAFQRHQNSNPDHLQVAAGRQVAIGGNTLVNQIARADARDNPIKAIQMRTAYYVVKNGLPLHQLNGMMELQVL